MFDSCMKWWYWKFSVIGAIVMTFLDKPLTFMSCNVMCFCLKWKLIWTLMGGCIKLSCWIQCDFVNEILWT
jgi:hypothetical protein